MSAPSGPEPTPDQDSRARAITLPTVLKPFRTLQLRLLFGMIRLFPNLLGIRGLGSVYFTRWSILTSIPYNGPPQVAEPLAHPYMIWESDYNGLAEPYIEAFAYVVDRQIDLTWNTSYGYPGTRSITDLIQYIERQRITSAYYYSAYRDASVRMVLSASAIAREHEFLKEAARSTKPHEFAAIYRGFLVRRQGDL